MARAPLLLAALLFLATSAAARDTRASIRSDQRSLIPLTRPFAFAGRGHVVVKLSGISVRWPDQTLRSLTGFRLYLLAAAEEDLPLASSDERCGFLSQTQVPVTQIASFDDAAIAGAVRTPGVAGNTSTVSLDCGDRSGVFTVLFANCVEGAAVSFDVRTQMFNLDSSGNPDYLSVGEQELPTVYLVGVEVERLG